jgi:hypothetical protein
MERTGGIENHFTQTEVDKASRPVGKVSVGQSVAQWLVLTPRSRPDTQLD